MPVRDKIIKLLEDALAPLFLKVEDFSESHRGHAGYREGGSHFAVTIVSSHFTGKTAIERQRLIYQILDDDLRSGVIHALTLKTLTPEQADSRRPFND